MKTRIITALLLILMGMSVVGLAMGEEETTFAPNVDSKTGAIGASKTFAYPKPVISAVQDLT